MARPRARRKSPKATTSPEARQIPKSASGKKPNILVIWGDDIGIFNLSCYSHGVMGIKHRTSTRTQPSPNCSTSRISPWVTFG